MKSTHQTVRRVLWTLYLILGLIGSVSYLVASSLAHSFNIKHGNEVINKPDPAVIGVGLFALLALFLAFVLYLVLVLAFRYRARNLLWHLVPFVGGLAFGVRALISRKKPEALKIQGKSWDVWALLGLFGLDQLTGSFILNFAVIKHPNNWIVALDVVLFVLTLGYFIGWGRKRWIAQWRLTNIWQHKWKILLAVVVMVALTQGYGYLMTHFFGGVPTSDNQAGLNEVAKLIPGWLMWLHLAFGAPIMEETIFRAGIYELISPKHPKIAFFASAIVFAFIHMMNPDILVWQSWIFYLIAGFVLSGLYYKTRKVEATATVHFLWNCVLSYFLPY